MCDYAIFVDASADIDPRLMKEDIGVVAMSYTLGDEARSCAGMEDAEILKHFYDGQRMGDLIHTSQVSPQQYLDAFEPVLATGRDILYISLSGGLTNSHDSVRCACQELGERYSNTRVIAVDSISATGGIGLLVERATQNREAGMTIVENAADIEALKHRVCHIFMVEDLMYLKRGGRVSAATAVVGTALGIKPILVIDEAGSLRIVGKQRGSKRAISDMLSRCLRSRDTETHRINIVHADAPWLAARLSEETMKLLADAEITTGMLSPIIGAHTGPGMAAIIYFGDREKIL